MIIDFHTHIFPQGVAERAVAKLEKTASVHAHTDGTLSGLLQSMNRAGVDRAVTLPVATNPDSVPSINDFAIGLQAQPRLISFGAMHPDFGRVEQELERIAAAGLKGIKLHPDYQGTFIDDPSCMTLLSHAARLGLVVVVHGGVDDGYTWEPRCSPRRVAAVLPRLENLKLVVAHYGGNRMLEEVRRHLLGSGVYIDTSFTHTVGLADECAALLRAWEPERILFGTDSPWDDQEADIAFIKGLDMGANWEARVFSDNAGALLGL